MRRARAEIGDPARRPHDLGQSVPPDISARWRSISSGEAETYAQPPQDRLDRYRVTFSGDAFTSRDTVEGYLLYRSAELTLQNGYDWFRVTDRETEREVVRESGYDPWYGPDYPYWRPSWRYYSRPYGWRRWDPWIGDPFWSLRLDMRTVEHWEASAEIVMTRGPRPPGDGRIFSAREVIDRLGPTIRRPEYGG